MSENQTQQEPEFVGEGDPASDFIAPFVPPPNAVKIDQMYEEVDLSTFTPQELNAGAKANRIAAYKAETDPMFFKIQRGEITHQEWLDAIQAIKDRFPYVPE